LLRNGQPEAQCADRVPSRSCRKSMRSCGMQPKRKRRKRHHRAERQADEAWDAFERGEIERAVTMMERAVRAAPDHPGIWTDYARVLIEADRLREAEKAVRNAILIGPEFADAWVELSRVLSRKGITIEAYRAASKAAELRPQVALYEEIVRQRAKDLPPDYGSQRRSQRAVPLDVRASVGDSIDGRTDDANSSAQVGELVNCDPKRPPTPSDTPAS
jgi:tetratricopeptide (TPR) repeat protein